MKTINDQPQQQQCAGGKTNASKLSIPKSPNGDDSGSGCSNGHLGAERRYRNDYYSGVYQFGGEFKINFMSGDRISVKQTFNGNDGPFFIMAVEKSGIPAVHAYPYRISHCRSSWKGELWTKPSPLQIAEQFSTRHVTLAGFGSQDQSRRVGGVAETSDGFKRIQTV
ncbi:hypothetical protein C2857_005805 [Epichloe festucae Fl1]|uniref:Uncharacterized protein n=1 Tax=Epichloe festucae (strain Fl1) TaxID=877507 RepID=A0A7S9KT25_EPIFF|nr:hypothetical protein C2857_005805 [Epichloe festucae Fl1]